MLKPFIILSLILAVSVSAMPQEISGTWTGTLNVTPQHSMKLVFNIKNDSVILDSPDQNAYGISCETNHLSSDSIDIQVSRLGMRYGGSLKNDSIKGIFRQGAFSLPLNLGRGTMKANRPQTPQPPFPYSTEDVVIQAPEATLAGTLTIPENASASTPVAVLVSGSGLQNRDEEIFDHKPFAVIADYLAKNGIATLRYDDRGCGESNGDATGATTADFASDAEAAVDYLRKSGRFSRIGLIGHSEGGTISYILAAKPQLLDFIVAVAGPSIPGTFINAYQNKTALLSSGIDTKTAEDFGNALLRALDYRLSHRPMTEVPEKTLSEIYPQHQESPLTRQLATTISATLAMESIQPWMEHFLRFDPAPDMRKIKIPAFLIYGEKDCQVPPSLCVSPAERNVPDATVKTYPGLNHMMQHAATGRVNEYKEIEETFSPEVLSDIVSFINGVTR